jgi:hypothetical protein
MRRTSLTLSLLTAVLAGAPAVAQAAFFPGEQVDGPSPDILSVEDVDVARDGGGALLYRKLDGGVPHLFMSQLTDGALATPARFDAGIGPATQQAVLTTANDGRMAVAWVAEGQLWTSVRPRNAQQFTAPRLLTDNASNPAIDMSINGATYLSFTQGGDVKVARANRDDPAFTVLAAPVDVNQAADAGTGPRKRSRVAVAGDGTAVVVWGEDGTDGRTHVYSRRIFEQRLSVAPQDLTLTDFGGRPAGPADAPEIDIEDDSSYAQVVFRQTFNDGGPSRAIMRRLRGSQYEEAVAVDAGAAGGGGRVDLTGRGEGLIATQLVSGEVIGSTLFNNAVNFSTRFDTGASGVNSQPVPVIGENEDGTIAWINADRTVRARENDSVERPVLTGEAVLSNPAFGPVDPARGFDASGTRAADAVVAFIQGEGAERRIVAGYNDRVPGRPMGSNTQRVRRFETFRWSPGINVLGAPTYRILLDGRPIGETRETSLTPAPGTVPEGEHTWQIVVIDRRGQQQVSRTRRLRIDNTPPTIRATFRRRGRVLTVIPRAGDPDGAQPSGVNRIQIDFGNGRRQIVRGRFTYRYPRGGSYRVRVRVLDRAGNEAVLERRVTIGR